MGKYQVSVLFTVLFFFHYSNAQDEKQIEITPVIQQTPVWCWLAVGEMVFTYFDIPNVNPVGNYQCGIIGLITGPQTPCFYNCYNCVIPAGSTYGMTNMLKNYPLYTRNYLQQNSSRLKFKTSSSSLSIKKIKEEIDNDRPIVAGISPSGIRTIFPEHVCVVSGYKEVDEGDLELTIVDPFPFYLLPFGDFNTEDPYIKAGGESNDDGTYIISYKRFKQKLVWRASWYGFEAY